MTAELSNKARAEVRRHRLLAIGAILIAAGTFGFLALGGLGKSLVYYWSPSELRAHGGKAWEPSNEQLLLRYEEALRLGRRVPLPPPDR